MDRPRITGPGPQFEKHVFHPGDGSCQSQRKKKDAYVFVGDRWKEPLDKTLDIFLPITFTGPDTLAVYWKDKWDMDSAFGN